MFCCGSSVLIGFAVTSVISLAFLLFRGTVTVSDLHRFKPLINGGMHALNEIVNPPRIEVTVNFNKCYSLADLENVIFPYDVSVVRLDTARAPVGLLVTGQRLALIEINHKIGYALIAGENGSVAFDSKDGMQFRIDDSFLKGRVCNNWS